MTKKAVIEQISVLVAAATLALKEAESLAISNSVPFDFQLATLTGKRLYESEDYDRDYPDNTPEIVSTENFENEGWDSSGLYC